MRQQQESRKSKVDPLDLKDYLWIWRRPQTCLWSLMTFKGKIEVIEFLMGCVFWMVHVMTKVYMKHIVSHIWYFSWSLDLWPWMTFKGQNKYNWNFYGLHLLNGACYDQSVHATHTVSHIYDISVDLVIFDIGWPIKVKSMYLSV